MTISPSPLQFFMKVLLRDSMNRFLFFTSLIFLVACQPIKAPRGNLLTDNEISQLKIGSTKAAQALDICGSPSLFKDNNTWIYIGGIGAEHTLKTHEISKKRVVKLIFNKKGILKKIDVSTPDDSQITMDSETTHFFEK